MEKRKNIQENFKLITSYMVTGHVPTESMFTGIREQLSGVLTCTSDENHRSIIYYNFAWSKMRLRPIKGQIGMKGWDWIETDLHTVNLYKQKGVKSKGGGGGVNE